MPKTSKNAAPKPSQALSTAAERIELLPLDQIREDPDQPRKTFKEESLEALAANIEATAGRSRRPWRDGLLHPVVVVPEPGWQEGAPGPRYRLLVGARRLRSYRLRAWPKIPARVLPAPEGAAHTLLVQLNENLGREDTSLWEDAQAVSRAFAAWKAEHPDGSGTRFAKECRRSKTWLSRHLAIARAQGLPRKALEQDRLGHGEAFRLFCQLPSPVQRRLLREAEKHGQAITAAVVREAIPLEASAAPAHPARSPKANAKATGSAAKGKTREAPPASREPSPRSRKRGDGRSIPFVLTPHELRRLLEALGHPAPPNDDALESAFAKVLAAL